ncbi:transposase InsO family protein [Clostridium algidicarnis DSM 15099]|uniref:Transposase InsO family protein n=2 Tax=Clostridium algidicarnis TaxID=37659 RepID=A0A2S6FVA2_9CLOT|nr:transposase InsO family protein [Clostridium algidicarnis DSM 15099]
MTIVELIKEANENGARLIPSCEVCGISKRTFERWRKGGTVNEDKRKSCIRPEPKNKLSKSEYQSVLNTVNRPEFADLPPSQIVPALADRGIYIASESTFYRILRAENMQHHRRNTKAPERVKMPTTHIADGPNQVWTWDITWLNTYTRGIYYKLYTIIDIYSRKIVGWEVWTEETGELASELVERTLLLEKAKGKPLVLHSDNGAPMKSYTLKSKLEGLGVLSSYSRPRVSNDNPYSEAHFKTMKYRPGYPQDGFKSIDDAREWVSAFVYWYNNEHYHSGIKFMTPSSRHSGQTMKIIANRKKVYESARKLNPLRFNKGIRNWEPAETVALNPTDEIKQTLKTEAI